MMPIATVLERFPDARRSGNGWIARCPAHEDRSPSLSIGEGNDGTILLHCHAGCKTEEILRARNLAWGDLKSESSRRSTSSSLASRRGFATEGETVQWLERKNGKASVVWRYQDENGTHVGSILRWSTSDGGKMIRPISVHGGEWHVQGMTAPHPLYALADVIKSSMVVVTEGEKAADAARRLGYVATTSAHGAKSARQTDWAHLGGKDVVILPDNDDEGRSYADDVRSLLANCDPRPVVRVVQLPDLPEKGDIADLVEATGDEGLDALRRQIDKLIEACPPVDLEAVSTPTEPAFEGVADRNLGARTASERPTVWLEKAQKPRITDQSLAVLARDHFQRGGQLVRCTPTDKGVQIVAVTAESIDDTLNRRIRFMHRTEGRDGAVAETEESAPLWLSKTIVQMQWWNGIRHLDGVQYGPFIRPDGTVGGLTAGYDSPSRVWVDTCEDWQELANQPTEQQVNESVAEILEVIDEFPWENEVSKSAWLAMTLTRMARSAIQGPSPLFVINATTPGSGKTLLTKLAGIVAEGRSPGMMSLSRNDEEVRKVITAALQNGDGIIVFDNLNEDLRSAALDRFLTSTQWSDRLLGKSQMVSLPNLTVPIITTNNGTIGSDTARRSIAISLSPLQERPEDREFRIPDIEAYVIANRHRLVVAAIRIVQWHFSRQCPQQETCSYRDADGNDRIAKVKRFGSFEAWSAVVRQALLGVGLPDPVLTGECLKAADEDSEAFRGFLEAWADWDPNWRGSARQMLQALGEDQSETALALIEAIHVLVGEAGVDYEGTPKPAALGNTIRNKKGRNYSNLRVEWLSRSSSGARWQLVRVALPAA
jgi:hypothetical protein